MAFTINDFKSSVLTDNSGTAKQSHYELFVIPPQKILLSDKARPAFDTFRFRTESAEIPGRSITTSDYKSTGYGLTSKVGYGVVYPDVTISLLCSKELAEKRFFNAWQSIVVGNHTRNQNIRKHQSIGYYQDYTSSVAIAQYDEQGNVSYAMTLVEAYPIIVNSMPLNWGSDEFHKLTVQFAYKYFNESDEPEQGRGAIGGGFRSGLTVTGLPSIDSLLVDNGFPALGEITGIPFFSQNSFTLG